MESFQFYFIIAILLGNAAFAAPFKDILIPYDGKPERVDKSYKDIPSITIKAKEKFDQFFSECLNGKLRDLPQAKIDFWSNFSISTLEQFREALRNAQELKREGYPLKNFIFVVHKDATLRVAPTTIDTQLQKDLAFAKHLALANGQELLTSGEIFVTENFELLFDQHSGTYMRFVSLLRQEEIRPIAAEYFKNFGFNRVTYVPSVRQALGLELP